LEKPRASAYIDVACCHVVSFTNVSSSVLLSAYQPTLTQMVNGSTGEDECADRYENDDEVHVSTSAVGSPESGCSDHNYVEHSIQQHGTMDDFREAAARGKRSTGNVWDMAGTGHGYDDVGIDALLKVLDETEELDSDGGEKCDSTYGKLQPLTQRGESAVEKIESSVLMDQSKVDAITRGCPNWKENVHYVQRQYDTDELNDALQQVQEKRSRMEALKAQLLQAYDDRVEALELFERSVQSRINALSADQEQSQYVDEEL
jgi:hypothetical protein